MNAAAQTQPKADPTRTRVDSTLASAEKRYQGDPPRVELIALTRRFKSSWIELAAALANCRDKNLYQPWGHRTFEDYYRRELHLKGATVDKMLGSFCFLQGQAPEVLERDGVEERIPDFQAVDFLRRAAEAQLSGNAEEATVSEIRRAVIDDNLSLPKITRLFKESLFPSDEDDVRRRRTASIYRAAGRLLEQLPDARRDFPPGVARAVEEALTILVKSDPDGTEAGEDEAEAPPRNGRRQAAAQA